MRFSTAQSVRAATRASILAAPEDEIPTAEELAAEASLLSRTVSPSDLDLATRHAEDSGVPVLDALLSCTNEDPDYLAERLAGKLGVEVLDAHDAVHGALAADDARAAMQSGILRLANGDLVVSLRGRSVLELARRIEAEPHIRLRARLATPQRFTEAVVRTTYADLAARIEEGPARLDARFSARGTAISRISAAFACLVIATSLFAAIVAPLEANIAFGLLFMTLTVLRLLAIWPDVPEPTVPRIPDAMLPIYTILVPLYREPSVVPALIAALSDLDYPEARLDIKILIEPDDSETSRALRNVRLGPHITVVTVPEGGPRTKPRALNAGLALARGSLLTVFDAEDRPDPGQLRAAVRAFSDGPAHRACVQARLVIDNSADGWLTRIFALEYAGLFDALLPALARTRLLFPLGGTSNHFRTAVLDRIGGWDAWNVTEDADLGLRLARLGHSATVIASSTWEEAPNRTASWVRQRTRWMKGYMMTWTLHMRQPLRLYRELGLVNFLTFHAFIGGVWVSALILPIFLFGVMKDIAGGVWLTPADAWHSVPPFAIHGFNLVLGFGTAMALAAIGADRRRLKGVAIWIPTVPAYWLLGSLAAWRAAWQLLRAPFKWEKTDHGLARTSLYEEQIKDGF